MIRLQKLTTEIEEKHAKDWATHVRKTLKEETTPHLAKYPALSDMVTYLLHDIEKKLVAPPQDLRTQIFHIKAEYPAIDGIFAKPAEDRTVDEKALVTAFKLAYAYDKFSPAKRKSGGYHLVGAYKQRMCPYCHGSHINYHSTGDGRMRPALDHFYPESKYPYLAISLYNLIPACHQCNSSMKSDDDPFFLGAPHPFEFVETDVKFSLNPKFSRTSSVNDDLLIKVHATTLAATAHIKLFALQERYQWYAPEISDVCEQTRRWLDARGPLQSIVSREVFACGFEKDKMRSRILGRCLLEVSEQVSKLISS